MARRHRGFERVLAIWAGEADVDTLEDVAVPGYRGHIGLRERDLAQLKQDIVAFRLAAPGLRFRIEHQMRQGEWLATRLTAYASDARTGEPTVASGQNMSRWRGDMLEEEWAVWEPLRRAP